ncbi:MAG: LamG-like jellyroll fold domain-containing protein [Tepidisphaeraceae bacterium]
MSSRRVVRGRRRRARLVQFELDRLEQRTLLAVSAQINFQPTGSPVPAGYLADTGALFADRGNGYSYGWSLNNSTTTRDRNNASSPDQRYDTLIHLQKPENPDAIWEIGLPNGSYTVHAVCGDSDHIDSVFRLLVEGVTTVSGTPTAAVHWLEGTSNVTVTDGRLTVRSGAGASNNKICFIDIVSADVPLVSIAATDSTAAETGPDAGTFTVTRTGDTSAPLAVNYSVGGSATSGSDYQSLAGSLTIPAGSASATIDVSPLDDPIAEGTESVVVTIVTDAAYLVSAPASAVINILDNDSSSALPVAQYNFDEGAGNTTSDSSGQNNTANLVGGAAWTVGRNGSGIEFDGSSGYLTAPNKSSLNPTTAISLIAWVKADTWANGNRRILQKGNTDNQYRLTGEGGLLKFHLAGVNGGVLTTALPSTGVWHHVAATYDGATMRIFLDGVDVANGAAGGAIATTSDPLYIGHKAAGSWVGNLFDGVMDDVRIYSRALSTQEIQQLVGVPVLPVVSVVASDSSAAEQALDPGRFTVTRTGDTSAPLIVQYTVSGSATAGSDYSALSGTVTIQAGANSATIDVVPQEDPTLEGSETVVLTLGGSAEYTIGSPANATVTILDNETAPVSDLLVHYLLDEAAGNTASDASGQNNPASLLGGATWTAGKTGSGIEFNGSTGYLTAPNKTSLNPTTGITLAAWIKVDAWAGGNRRILQKGNTDNQYRLTEEIGVLKFHLAGVTNGIITTALPSTGVWHHVAATYDGANLRIFIDGGQAVQQSGSGAIATSGDPLYIATKTVGATAGDFFDGVMDDIRIYSRALTSAEVAALFGGAPALPTVSVTAADASASEQGPDNGTFTVTRTGDTSAALVVSYAASGSATPGADYQVLPGTVTIPAGSSSVSFSVLPIDDSVVEGSETVIVTLGASAEYVVVGASSTVNIADNDADLTTALAAHYKLDENGGSVASDVSGQNNPASVNGGATWVTGKLGSGIDFNGTTGHLLVPNKLVLNPTSGISIVAWIKVDSWAGGNRRILQKGNTDNQYRFTEETGVLKFHLAGVTNGTLTTALPSTGVWHHVAGTYNGSALRIYLDGAQVAQQSGSGAIATTGDPLYIGTKTSTAVGTDFFDGSMDEIRIYGRGLSAQEVSAIFALGTLPTIGISATDSSAAEVSSGSPPDTGTFTITRTGSTSGALTVNFTIGGSAGNGSDYETITGSALIPAGQSTTTVLITPVDDPDIEATESVVLSLQNNAAYVVGAASSATLSILDNDATNHSPFLPDITEPLNEGERVSGFDVHMEIGPFSDPDPGQSRLSSDWEIWTRGTSPVRVWSNHNAPEPAAHHTHFGDGTFEGPQAGQNKLQPDTDYELRVRTRDDSGEAATEFSEWAIRNFHTLVEDTATAPGWVARQSGYRIEEVPFSFAVGEADWRLPTNLAFVPAAIRGPHPLDPLFYVAELYGSIRVVTNNYTVMTYATGLLNYNPVGPITGSGENGMGGIVVDPTTGDLFATMLYDDLTDGTSNTFPKISRFTSTDGGLHAATQTDILLMPGESMHQSHIISNISFGPDDKLYVHVGDGFEPATAQNLLRFKGKVLRLNRDGSAPTDNPHYDPVDRGNDGKPDAEDYWYARGYRNPFGGIWRDPDPSTGRAPQHWVAENGPSSDRLSMLVRDRNYLYDGSDASMRNFNIAYSPTGSFENGADDWNPAPAPVELAFIQASADNYSLFPQDKWGHAFVALSGPTHASGPNFAKSIQEWIINDNGTRRVSSGSEPANPRELASYEGSGYSTAAGLAAGPDGLYFTTLYPENDPTATNTGGKIFRIVWTGSVNRRWSDEQFVPPLNPTDPTPLSHFIAEGVTTAAPSPAPACPPAITVNTGLFSATRIESDQDLLAALGL